MEKHTPDAILSFTYTDAKGNTSKRRIINYTLYRIEGNPHAYIKGVDIDKSSFKQFRLDRATFDEQDTLKELSKSIQNYPRTSRNPAQRDKEGTAMEVLFTGFLKKSTRPFLEEAAKNTGLDVKKTVTKNLGIIVDGGNMKSKSKIQKALDNGAIYMNQEDFMNFIETGEVPKNAS